MPDVPAYVDDGNFKLAQQDGAADGPSFPFSSKGDLATFVYVRNMVVDADSWRTPIMMQERQFPLGRAYLVDIEPPVMAGQKLLRYSEIYSSVPATRSEYGSTTYTRQNVVRTSSIPPRISINETTATTDCRIVYEYSAFKPLPKLFAPVWRIRQRATTGSGLTFGNPDVLMVGNYVVTENNELLAEDSTTEIYMGQIFCRRTTFVSLPPERFPDTTAEINGGLWRASQIFLKQT